LVVKRGDAVAAGYVESYERRGGTTLAAADLGCSGTHRKATVDNRGVDVYNERCRWLV